VVIELYHITHVDNIGSIMECGALCCDADRAEWGVRPLEIADLKLKQRRLRRRVDVPPGGVLADYVPFYFAPRSPMLNYISHGNVPGCRQDDVVYVVTTVENIQRARLSFVFTDMHPLHAFSKQSNDPAELPEVIDWRLMRERYWFSDPERDPDRKLRRQAEFLVHRQLPGELITTLAVRNTAAARQVLAAPKAARRQIGVHVKPDWYFLEGGSHDRADGSGERPPG
jgi:hypothetical protein